MANRDLSLTERNEEVRDKQQIIPVVSFSLAQIKNHFDQSVLSITSQYEVADSLLSQGKTEACKDIWRSQIVFVESSLDFYIHELSQYAMMQIFKGNWPKTAKYNKFLVPMSVVEEGIKHPETSVWFEKFLNQRFSREVYLSHDSMREQMNLLGLSLTNIFETAFPKVEGEGTTYRSGAKIVGDLFSRRNQIAHQSDRAHANAEKNEISKDYVQQCIAEVCALVDAMHNAAIAEDA